MKNVSLVFLAVIKMSADEVVLADVKGKLNVTVTKEELKNADDAERFLFSGGRLENFLQKTGLGISATDVRKIAKEYIKKHVKKFSSGNTKPRATIRYTARAIEDEG